MKLSIFNKNTSTLIIAGLLVLLLLGVRSGKYTYILNILFFTSLFVMYPKRLSIHNFRYLLFFIFLLLWGFIHGNHFNSIVLDIGAFSPLILIFIEREPLRTDLLKRLLSIFGRVLPYMILLSFFIFNYMEYTVGGIETVRFNYNAETKLALFAPISPISIAPFTVFFLSYFTKRQKFFIHFANILIILMGVITLTRSAIIIGLTPYLLLFLYKLPMLKIGRIIKSSLVLIVLFFILAQSGIISKYGLNQAFFDLKQRNSNQIKDKSIGSGRIEEVEDYLSQDLSISEYLIGRGLGGRKVDNENSNYIGGIDMMHIGPVHAFLKGGILLVLLLYVPLLFAVFRFWRTPNWPLSLLLLYFLIYNLQTTNWGLGFFTFFYWYSISTYYYSFKKMRSVVINNN